jgi:hypothetical protein
MVQMCLDSFRIRYIRTFLYRCDPKIRPENPRKLRESSAKDPWEPRPAGMAPRNSIRERLISGSIEQVLFVPATTNHRPTGHRPPATGHQMQCPSRCCRNDNSCKRKSIEKTCRNNCFSICVVLLAPSLRFLRMRGLRLSLKLSKRGTALMTCGPNAERIHKDIPISSNIYIYNDI